ncbi:MAG: ArsR family transcriptional regulator [Promethearchaeota archaeon]|nr:MAG: ArsR family transcriptional regulator [Candidatus Lokiarchaeota archaeon]
MSELTEKIADFLKVLGDQTRLEVLDLLKNGEKTSKEIEAILGKSQSTISQHLKILIEIQLIDFEKKGNKNYYKIKYDYIFKILTFIQSLVVSLESEKRRKVSDLDILDTLGV